jgi:predicted RNase H-like nuclease (RuvC/YqgF family)
VPGFTQNIANFQTIQQVTRGDVREAALHNLLRRNIAVHQLTPQDQAILDGILHELGTGRHAHLLQDARAVGADGGRTE